MNNEQIDNTDYYRLPCGRYLEDFIEQRRLSFAEGSALKYAYRAGEKDGETIEKDCAKYMHYCRFMVKRGKYLRLEDAKHRIDELLEEADAWDGQEVERW